MDAAERRIGTRIEIQTLHALIRRSKNIATGRNSASVIQPTGERIGINIHTRGQGLQIETAVFGRFEIHGITQWRRCIDTTCAHLDDHGVVQIANGPRHGSQGQRVGLNGPHCAIARVGVVDHRTRIDDGACCRQGGAARRVDVSGTHVANLFDPDAVLCPSRQSACRIVAQGDLHGLACRTNGALCGFQNGFLALYDRHTRIGHAQNGVGDFDTDLARSNDFFQVGSSACRVSIGRVCAQIHKAVGRDVQAVGQHIEGVFLDHRQGPGVAVERHVVRLCRHDDQLFIVGQLRRFSLSQPRGLEQGNRHRTIVLADFSARTQHHAVAHHVGLFNAGLRAGRALGEDRLGQGVFQLSIRPSGQCPYFSLVGRHIGRIDGCNDFVVVGLVHRGPKLLIQGQHFGRAVIFDFNQLCFAHTCIQQLLALFSRDDIFVVSWDCVSHVAGDIATAIDDHIAHIAQGPIAAVLRARQVQCGLTTGFGRCTLQSRRPPQSQQFGFRALVTRFVAVVVDQIATRFQVHISTRDDLVHPQVARELLDGDAVARFGGQATKGRVLRLDVQGRLVGAIHIELPNAACGSRQVNLFARHMHSSRVKTQDVARAVQPNLARGRHAVDAQGATVGVEGDRAGIGHGRERAIAGDQVDGRSLNANTGLGPEVQANAFHHSAVRQLRDAAVGGRQRHIAAGIRDVAPQSDVTHTAHRQCAGVVAHQLYIDRVVCRHPLCVQILVAHLGAPLDVIGLLDAQEAALAPRAVIGFGLVIGDRLFHLHREVTPTHRRSGADKHVLRHRIGRLDHGIDVVPTGAAAGDEAQPRRVLVVIRLLSQGLIACRPRVGAVGQRVVIEAGLHAARRAGQRIGDHITDHPCTRCTAIGHRTFEDAVGILFKSGHLVGHHRAF